MSFVSLGAGALTLANMVEFIRGILAGRKPAQALIEVNGLGYDVLIPTSTFEQLPGVNSPVRLLTHLYVRDDVLQLFGFFTESERTLFRLMITVRGIGPKIALSALSAMTTAALSASLTSRDSTMLTRIPGIGRKTAERLVLELHDKVSKMGAEGLELTAAAQQRADALAALETLGLTRAAAERRLRIVRNKHPEAKTASELIRLALNE